MPINRLDAYLKCAWSGDRGVTCDCVDDQSLGRSSDTFPGSCAFISCDLKVGKVSHDQTHDRSCDSFPGSRGWRVVWTMWLYIGLGAVLAGLGLGILCVRDIADSVLDIAYQKSCFYPHSHARTSNCWMEVQRRKLLGHSRPHPRQHSRCLELILAWICRTISGLSERKQGQGPTRKLSYEVSRDQQLYLTVQRTLSQCWLYPRKQWSIPSVRQRPPVKTYYCLWQAVGNDLVFEVKVTDPKDNQGDVGQEERKVKTWVLNVGG